MSLTEYKKKRDFKKTAEPAAGRGKAKSGELLYVIQKHAASRLHYDFRLELEGTLKSWAVPKGPSLDPHQKQLAVHVEDHPVAYGDFEGIIPKGEYGGGTVMVWDQGTWEPLGNAARDYRAGKLKFKLHGRKLKGNWALIQMHGDAGADGKNWLLIKEDDRSAKPESDYVITESKPLSVLSRRDLDQIADDADDVWSSNRPARSTKPSKTKRSSPSAAKTASRKRVPRRSGEQSDSEDEDFIDLKTIAGAKRAPLPERLAPQLATLVSHAPQGDQWLHELKFDGYRLMSFVDHGSVRLITRNGNDWSERFPSIEAAVKEMPLNSGILDGEVAVFNAEGAPDFQRLQNAMKSTADVEFIYFLFDLPFCDGFDLRTATLLDRKRVLQQRLKAAFPDQAGIIRYSEHVQAQGADVASQACQHELEGIISKEADSHYQSGRSRAWVKTKCQKRQEFVIGGYTSPGGARGGFGSLLLGYYDNDKLRYCGKVGTGFTAASLKQVLKQLKQREVDDCPFVNVPRAARHQLASWVKPELIAEVEFTEWTDEDSLRHPAFKGLREDKPPTDIVQEVPVMASSKQGDSNPSRKRSSRETSHKTADRDSEFAGIAISHPDRMVYPGAKLTKADIAQYYSDVADWILPHVVDRPLSLVRCPDGQKGECFYQKHFAGPVPQGIVPVRIQEKSKSADYPTVKDITGLISLVQWGVLEIHPWGSKADKIESPDRIVFDLDPGEGATWEQVVQGAKDVRERLLDLGLESFLRTSGGKGLHIVIPLTRRNDFDTAKDFAHAVATAMMHDSPDLYIDNMSKAKRKGRVFIDYLRNGRGATAIACYSTRAREGAPVATPLRWDELSNTLSPNHYTVHNIRERLQALKADPWEHFFEIRQSLTKRMLDQV